MRHTVLLVIPPIVEDPNKWYAFPIGIAYVSAALKQAGFPVQTLNLNYKKNPIEILKNYIAEHHITVVGTGGLSTQYPDIKDIVRTAKEVNPNIVTMVGGGIITGDPAPAMEALEYADYGMIGEGEETCCQLVDYLINSVDYGLDQIDGIIYKKENQYVVTNPRKEIMDLDTIPFPDYAGFEYEKVVINDSSLYIYSEKALNTASICGSRSCVYNCTFCFHSSGKKYRQRSLDNIFKEIDWLLETYPIQQLFIVDELFANNIARLEEFCQRIKKYNLPWIASLRVDIITKPLLELLKDANCKAIGFGLESADDRILKSMRKNITISQIDNALKLCNEVGILSSGGFIFGDLEETRETSQNTINWWKEHPEYYIKLSLISVYPGSYLYKVALKRGIIKDPVQFLKNGCPMVNVSKLSDQEFADLAAQIDFLPLERKLIHLNNHSVEIKNNRINLTADCPFCHYRQTWEGLDAFRRIEYNCTNCHKKFEINVYEYLDLTTFSNNILNILKKYKKIGIWPRTSGTYNMIKSVPLLNDPNVFVIDKSVLKQKSSLYIKTYSPEIIRSENIPCVIINIATNVEGEIERQILRNYPEVKKIWMARELLEELNI